MPARLSSTMPPALLVLSLACAAGAGAQQAQCDVNEGSPTQVARAMLAVSAAQQAQATGRTDDAAKQLQAAVRGLTDAPEKIDNPLGRQMVLGKALVIWLEQPGMTAMPTRGSLGFTTYPGQPIDIAAAIDSAFTAVETAQPGCAGATAMWRGQKAWLALVNGAIQQLNGGSADSAAALARRSLVLYRGAPYGHMVLGNVAYQQRRQVAALEHYRTAVAAAASDTSFADNERQLALTVGNIAAEIGDTAQGPAKQQWLREATTAYEAIVAKFPGSQEARVAAERLPRTRLAAGDTAGVRASYAGMLEAPEKFTWAQLLNAGVAAGQANMTADAARLFEGVLKVNPYHRDALYNVALMYNQLEQPAKGVPFIQRLVQVDPDNEDNWMLYAFAYNGMVKGAKTKAQSSALRDSVGKYYKRGEDLPHKVRFTEWSTRAEGGRLRGAILNKGAAPKGWTMAIEFLDAAGQVVGTQTVTVAPVAPKAEGAFAAEVADPRAVAFRYKALQ